MYIGAALPNSGLRHSSRQSSVRDEMLSWPSRALMCSRSLIIRETKVIVSLSTCIKQGTWDGAPWS